MPLVPERQAQDADEGKLDHYQEVLNLEDIDDETLRAWLDKG